jgi:hypothetical protein
MSRSASPRLLADPDAAVDVAVDGRRFAGALPAGRILFDMEIFETKDAAIQRASTTDGFFPVCLRAGATVTIPPISRLPTRSFGTFPTNLSLK